MKESRISTRLARIKQIKSTKGFYTIVSLLLSFIIIAVTLFFNSGFIKIQKPSFNFNYFLLNAQPLKTINDYNSYTDLLNSETQIWYGKRPEYLFFQVSPITCKASNCDIFDGGQNTMQKIFNEYVKKGKASYSYASSSSTEESLQSSFYCVVEQKPKATQSYSNYLIAGKKKELDETETSRIITRFNLNINKFRTCMNENKYKDRSERIAMTATNISTSLDPKIIVFKKVEIIFRDTNGKESTLKRWGLVRVINLIDSYEEVKREIDSSLQYQ